MAEGYARITGNPGVCLVTSGPGATNMITPMQDALSDGTPMVVFSGQVPTTAIGTDAFQEADVIGISRACTKWNVMVKDINELPRRINEAFYIAMSGRPGPVLVDLPKDVTASTLNKPIVGGILPKIPGKFIKNGILSATTSLVSTTSQSTPTTSAIAAMDRIAKLLNKAKKPLLYVGQGLLSSPDGPALLKQLALRGNIPVTTTLQGLGAFDETHELSLHMLGMHGSAYANLAVQSADLIIALGARFDDRVTGNLKRFAPAARRAAMSHKGGIVQFEISPKNVNKTVHVDDSVEGDVGTNLKYFLEMVQHRDRIEWIDQLNEWKAKYPFYYTPSKPGERIKPQRVIEELNRQTEHMKDRVIVTTGVGQHQMWAAQYFRWRYP